MLQVKIQDARYESKMVSKGEFNPMSEDALVCVTETKKGVYLVQYSTPAHGNFTIYVKIDDKPIPESPFNIKVHPDPSQCKVFGNAIKHPHSLVLGKSIEFKVDTTEAGTGELTAIATNPGSSEIKVMLKPDWKNKVYELKIDPKVIGEHKIDVQWNNEHIPDSPFTFDICDPSKVKVLKLPAASRYYAEVGKPLTFLVDPKKAGKGQLQCTVKVMSANDHEIAIEPKLQDDGTYSLEFVPHEIGQMQLNLTYNGESILPGPWECEIANPILKLHSSNSHEKQNQPVKFKVSGLAKRTESKLKISISHPRHKNPKPLKDSEQRESDSDTSVIYHFIPSQLGKYDISVKIDTKDICGSPLSVNVVNPEACITKGAIPTTIFLQQRKKFTIDTSRAGPGELSREIENGDQSSTPKLDCKIISTDPGNVTVEVSGLEPGKCKLILNWGCYKISPMPLDVTVYDPSQCSCKFEGITTSKVKTGDKVCVLIDTTKVGGCEPTVKARGSSTECHVELKKIGEGEYRASLIPNEDGHQNVEVFIDDVMVPNCPLTFKTYTPMTSATQPGPEDSHREISSPPTPAEPDSDLLNRTNEHHDDSSITFAVGVETNDTDTSQLHLETVKPKKRYRVRVKEEKPGEWKTTCSAEDKGEQELRVLRNESELIGQPIKISVRDQKKAGGLNYCKIVLVALLVLLMISVIVTLSLISITDPEIRPY
jgi:filamin